MYFDDAEGMVFRPPSEAESLILRVTIGCSHNACTFCSMYKSVKFRIRSIAEISDLISQAALFYPDTRRVFLADGNALALKYDDLLTILHLLKAAFPKLTRITCYGGPKDILQKSQLELANLNETGLQIIYLGIESGDDTILSAVAKGVTATEMIEAGKKVIASGIKLSAMLILGLGGRGKTSQHALNSAKVINAINPTMLSALTLMLHEDSALRATADNGKFQPLSPYGVLSELKSIVENIDVSAPCIFRSTHPSNFLPLAGTLPKDKPKLIRDIEAALSSFKNQTQPTYNNIDSW